MKKIISILIILVLIFTILGQCQAKTNDIEKSYPILNSKRYVIYDRSSGLSIYGKEENTQTAMASTTKIMSAIIVLENSKDLNDQVTISKKSASTGGSTLRITRE